MVERGGGIAMYKIESNMNEESMGIRGARGLVLQKLKKCQAVK